LSNVLAYTVADIQQMLNISRSTAYKLIDDPPFHIIRIGKSIRIPKEAFDKWLMQI